MRGSLEDRFLQPAFGEHGEHGEVAANLAAIDDAMRSAEAATSWPCFVTVLRARGPELRDRVLRLLELGADRSAPRSLRRSLLARLRDVGLGEEPRQRVAHADRLLERARGLWHALAEPDLDVGLDAGLDWADPRATEHEQEGDKAAWMHLFATILLCRVASGHASPDQPSTELAITLAVDSARDAYAHWATALELRSHADAA